MNDEIQKLKQQAAEVAVKSVKSGMVIGLGEGSTAVLALRKIGELIKSGDLVNIVGIPCSKNIESEAIVAEIPISTLEQHPIIDLTIDGADEVDPNLNLIKGGGGALFREKIVAQASKYEIIIVDETKLSPTLGTRWAVPIEVLPFGWSTQELFLTQLGASVSSRKNKGGEFFITDQGNYILDANFGPIENLDHLNTELNQRVGIVAHGLFLGLANEVIIARPTGIEIMTVSNPA